MKVQGNNQAMIQGFQKPPQIREMQIAGFHLVSGGRTPGTLAWNWLLPRHARNAFGFCPIPIMAMAHNDPELTEPHWFTGILFQESARCHPVQKTWNYQGQLGTPSPHPGMSIEAETHCVTPHRLPTEPSHSVGVWEHLAPSSTWGCV